MWYQSKQLCLKLVVEFVNQFIMTCDYLITFPCLSQPYSKSVSFLELFEYGSLVI